VRCQFVGVNDPGQPNLSPATIVITPEMRATERAHLSKGDFLLTGYLGHGP
jgi:hypothetical protein